MTTIILLSVPEEMTHPVRNVHPLQNYLDAQYPTCPEIRWQRVEPKTLVSVPVMTLAEEAEDVRTT
jgi:hypothetical protein